jgi:[acyl-carrier-protein] S-malonyltransferase
MALSKSLRKLLILFPGQGNQYVRMGKDFYEASHEARNLFDRANDCLQINLTKLAFEGPEVRVGYNEVNILYDF